MRIIRVLSAGVGASKRARASNCGLKLGEARLQRLSMAHFVHESAMSSPIASSKYKVAFLGRSASCHGRGAGLSARAELTVGSARDLCHPDSFPIRQLYYQQFGLSTRAHIQSERLTSQLAQYFALALKLALLRCATTGARPFGIP